MMRTRVRFADGTEDNEPWPWYDETWPDGTPRRASVLTAAVTLAGLRHGEAHTGAWLEFATGE